jgi:hypothetical protein
MQRGLLMLWWALRDATLQGSIRMCQLLRWIHFLHLLFKLGISQACIRKEFHTTLSTEINRYLSSLSFTIQIHRNVILIVFLCDFVSVLNYQCLLLFTTCIVYHFSVFLISTCMCHKLKCKAY